MKRQHSICTILMVSLLLFILNSCGRNKSTTTVSDKKLTAQDVESASGTVSLWAMGAEGELLGKFTKAFEKTHPNIKVEVTPIPWSSAHDKIQTAIAGGVTPDLAMMGTTWMSDFANGFAEVPDFLSMDDFFNSSVSTAVVDGNQVGVPWYVDTRVLYYRKDIAEKAGWTKAPATWDDFKKMAKDMQTVDGVKYGVRLQTTDSDAFQNSLWMPWSVGADVLNADKTAWTFNTNEMNEAFNYYTSFFKEKIANVNVDTSTGAEQTSFIAGDTPMLIEGPWFYGSLKDLAGDDFASKIGVGLLPAKKTGTSFIGGCNLIVFKDSKNPAAAWSLLKWMTSTDTQVNFWKVSGDLPAAKSAWKDPVFADDAVMSVFGKQLNDTKAPPSLETWTQVADAGNVLLEKMAREVMTPKEALEELQKQAEIIGVKLNDK